jgi:hypothetical protein
MDNNRLVKYFLPAVADNAPEINIYCPAFSARLEYTCRFIFRQVLKVNYKLVSKTEGRAHINYSAENIEAAVQVLPAGLLSETSVSTVQPIPTIKDGRAYFFPSEKSSGMPYDIFSAVFFFISRYEEWQPYEKDAHGRFEAASAILFEHNLDLVPWVDRWIAELRDLLNDRFPALDIPQPEFRQLMTIDVDNLYAYRSKGIVRTCGGIVKDSLRGDFKGLGERLRVLSGAQKDPFDIYAEVSSECKSRNIPIAFFFLYGGNTKYDRSIGPSPEAYGPAFLALAENQAFIGLHPSYNTFDSQQVLAQELSLLRRHSGSDVNCSRQHYLRFDIKETPYIMLRSGIRADFSMGFASSPGFRAGTAYPFYYYDFKSEAATELLFVPFCAMDGAYTTYSKATADEALRSLKGLQTEVRKTGGWFVTVYHERTFSERLYPGYARVFKELLGLANGSVHKGELR